MSLTILNQGAALLLLVHSMCALNFMTRRTNHVQRIAYLVLACGSLAVMLGPLYCYTTPAPAELVINIGAASVILTRVYLDWKARS